MARIEQVQAGEATWGEWWLDFAGHVGLGTAYSLVTVAATTAGLGWGAGLAVAAGTGAAGFGGVVREVYQGIRTGKLHLRDRAIDAATHLIGGPLGWLAWLGFCRLLSLGGA